MSWIQQNDYTAKSVRDCNTCWFSLQLILPNKGWEVQLEQLSGALCTGPVASEFAEMHSSPVDVVLKHFLIYVPFFISFILTYATIIFLCNEAHWNFSFLPSLYNQQVVAAQTSNPQPCGRVTRLLPPITCGAPLSFYGQLSLEGALEFISEVAWGWIWRKY